MLRISKAQVVAFEEANLGAFTLKTMQHLRDALPRAVAQLDDDALNDSLRVRLAQAFSYGVTDRFDVLRYLECSYVLNWTDDSPDEESLGVLARDDLSAETKVDLIEQRTESL